MATRRIMSQKDSISKNRPDLINTSLSRHQIQKSALTTSNDETGTVQSHLISTADLLPPPFPIEGLQQMAENSTILKQCITAYKRNIVGFGAIPSYKLNEAQEKRRQLEARLAEAGSPREPQEDTSLAPEDQQDMNATGEQSKTEETPEMVAEWEQVEEFIRYFNFDQSFEGVMSDVIEDREETGNGYMEIIRDGAGRAVEGHRLNPRHIKTTAVGDERVMVEFKEGDKVFTRQRKFRRYAQQIGTKIVWFKEMGDPRVMDNRTGKYMEDLEDKYQANEIWHLKIGTGAYGMPRWIGQLIHMYGSRKAEELNLRYFEQGRHTPMAVVVSNGHLSPQSDDEIAKYLESIEGVDRAHGFLVIEAEGAEASLVDGEEKSARVELKSMADMIQKDALFLDYDQKSREKVQSAFALPDIYIGRSQDFNRATAETAKEITEEQVFIPERKELEWQINHRLLQEYELKYAEMMFKRPETASVTETSEIIRLLVQARAVSTNETREILGNLLGFDLDSLGYEFDEVGGIQNASLRSDNVSSLFSGGFGGLTEARLFKNKGDTTGGLGETHYNEEADRMVNAVQKYLDNKAKEG